MATSSENEWEETIVMLELPTTLSMDKSKLENQYIQMLGLASERPVVKFNQLFYSGEWVHTAGSHLFVELEENADGEKSGSSSTTGPVVLGNLMVADRSLKLEPMYMEQKKNSGHKQRDESLDLHHSDNKTS